MLVPAGVVSRPDMTDYGKIEPLRRWLKISAKTTGCGAGHASFPKSHPVTAGQSQSQQKNYFGRLTKSEVEDPPTLRFGAASDDEHENEAGMRNRKEHTGETPVPL